MNVDNIEVLRLSTRNIGRGQVGFSIQESPDRQPATGTDILSGAGTSDFFTINFSNIRDLKSNSSSIEQHLTPTSPDLLLFPSET